VLFLAAQLNLILDQDCSADSPEWVCSTIEALPAPLVSSLTADRGLPAAGSVLTALTRLSFKAAGFNFPEPANFFGSLSRLRQLTIKTAHGASIDRMLVLPGLKDLQALRLLGCKSQAAPQALAVLTQLTALDLYNNQFSAIALLATLQRLQRLELSYSSLKAVPAQLSALTALTRLNLAGNALVDRGWQHLAPLIRLHDLNLFKCGLKAVPEQLSALSALTRLDLGLNKELRAFWQHFLPHTQLQDLDLSYCSSLAVLQPLSALAGLTSLKLTGIQLWNEWQLLLPLTQLRELSCKQCSLDAVPEQLSALTALTNLNLGSNRLQTGGGQHLLPLTQLQALNLSSCGLKAVPEQLSALTALTRLDLSQNYGLGCDASWIVDEDEPARNEDWQLACGCQHLLPLTQLQNLSFMSCHLQAVPEQLSALTTLTSLDLSTNRELAGGWQHLVPLTQLRCLYVEDVRSLGGEAPPELAALPQLRVYWRFGTRIWT
jgi:Leucine-rich repeat (LRR) protein